MLSASLSRLSGGLFYSMRHIAQCLAERPGWSVDAYGAVDARSADDRPAWAPIAPRLFAPRGPAGFGYAPGMRRAVMAGEYDLLHVHHLWMYPSLVTLAWQAARGGPYVITPNGMLDPWALAQSPARKRVALALYEGRHLRRAGCIHALAPPEAAAVRSLDLGAPIATIPTGADPAPPLACAPPAPWDSGGRRALLFLGRIHPKKGVEDLIDAFAAIVRERPGIAADWVVVLAGWGQAAHVEAARRRVEATGLDGRVLLTGPLHGAAKEAALRNACGFVLPSYSEGLPNALMEALAYGVGALITPGCNFAPAVEAGAALSNPPGVAGTRDSLEAWFTMSGADRGRMNASARSLIERDYTWAHCVARLEAVYEWLLGARDRPDTVEI